MECDICKTSFEKSSIHRSGPLVVFPYIGFCADLISEKSNRKQTFIILSLVS